MTHPLDAVLKRADVWRGASLAAPAGQTVATGYSALDRELPGGGWPAGVLTEIMSMHAGIGEVSIALPALAQLSRAGGWIAWIAPPARPYAPALTQAGLDCAKLLIVTPRSPAETLWAIEQTLRSNACAAVLGWPPPRPSYAQLRRLQIAAQGSAALGFLFRTCTREAAPAALRLELAPAAHGRVLVDIVKRRGYASSAPLELALHRAPNHALDRARAARAAARRLRAGELVN